MTKVKRTYTLHERELPYILSPANAIRALKLEYGRCRRTVTSPAPSQERFRTGTFDIPIVSSHDIQSGKVVALGFHPQHYVVDSHGKVRSALPHQLEIRARKLLGQQRSEVVFQSDAALAEVQELMKDPYPVSVTPAPSPTHTSQGPLPVKNKLPETQEEREGLLNDIGDTAGAGALILAGGIADRLGFDEVADNAFGAATDLLEKPGSSGAKEEAVAVLGTTLGAAKTVGDTLIGGAQLAGMAAQETAYDLLGGEQGLGSHIDSLQGNHENIEQIKASAGEAVKAFAQDIPGSLNKGIEAAEAAVDNVRSNVDSVANTESNVERLFASSKVGETTADTALALTGAGGLVRGGIKTATKNVGAVTDGGTAGRMKQLDISPSLRETGARRVLDPVSLEAWDAVEGKYDLIRANNYDTSKIAENIGWPEFRVANIKDHVFFKEHRLDSGLKRFDADPDIYNAWNRLEKGDFVEADLNLLRHEIFESKFEGIFKTDYRTAHNKTIDSGRIWNPE